MSLATWRGVSASEGVLGGLRYEPAESADFRTDQSYKKTWHGHDTNISNTCQPSRLIDNEDDNRNLTCSSRCGKDSEGQRSNV